MLSMLGDVGMMERSEEDGITISRLEYGATL